MQVPQGGLPVRGILLRRDVVHAWGPALLGLVSGFQDARLVDHVQHVVAHPRRRAPGLLGNALELQGDGWCARRLSQRSFQHNVMPGGACPPVGPVGRGAPPALVLCAAKTPSGPSRVASRIARVPIPCMLPDVRGGPCGLLPWVQPPGPARACGPPVPHAGHWARRPVVLPRSRVSPVQTGPALRPRWYPVHSPLSPTGLLPSGACTPSACASRLLRLSC
jgi:hypothetical protein